MAGDKASSVVARRGPGCLLRLFVSVVAFAGVVLAVDEVWPRLFPAPRPGDPRAGAPDPRLVLPTVDDLPPGFAADSAASGLIVTSRKAATSADPEATLDRLLRWGRLTGYRSVFTAAGADAGADSRIICEVSVFQDTAGARAYFESELRARPTDATPFNSDAGDEAAGWRTLGGEPGYSALRLVFVADRQVGELSLFGPDTIANPAEAERMAKIVADRIHGN